MSSLSLIDAVALIRVMWSALATSIVVTVTFSLAVLGLVKWTDLRAEQRNGLANAYGLLAAAGVVAFIGAVVYGVILITQKS